MLDAATNDLLTTTDAGTPMGDLFRRFWTPVLLSEELAANGAPARFRVMGEDLVAYRDHNGGVGVMDAYCPHRGAPMFFARNEAEGLRCLYHGWKFDSTGACTDMPNEPAESMFKEKVAIKAYPAREAGGMVWAYLGPEELMPEMPGLEALQVGAGGLDVWKYLVECNYLQAVEGDHDSSHISMLHGDLEGMIDDDGTARSEFIRGQYWNDPNPRLHVVETDYGFVTGSQRNGPEGQYYWRLSSWMLPWFSMIASKPGGLIHMNAVIPIDENHCWIYKMHWMPERDMTERERILGREASFGVHEANGWRLKQNRDNDYLVDRTKQKHVSFSGIETLAAEDRSVTERMRPASPDRVGVMDRTTEHLASSDAAIIVLRRKLLNAARRLEEGIEPVTASHPELYHLRTPIMELPKELDLDIDGATKIKPDTWHTTTTEYAYKVGAV